MSLAFWLRVFSVGDEDVAVNIQSGERLAFASSKNPRSKGMSRQVIMLVTSSGQRAMNALRTFIAALGPDSVLAVVVDASDTFSRSCPASIRMDVK
jgi:hypothetical protein